MHANVIFAQSSFFSEVPFNEWIRGDDDTALLVLEDNAVAIEAVKVLAAQVGVPVVSFRLHNSQLAAIKSVQRDVICGVWPRALELTDGFSHVGTDPIARDILKLGQSDLRNDSVRKIVRGAANQVILDALDALAAWMTLDGLGCTQFRDEAVQSLDGLRYLLKPDDQRTLDVASSQRGAVLKVLPVIATNYLD